MTGKILIGKCRLCGKEFTKRHPAVKYCDECSEHLKKKIRVCDGCGELFELGRQGVRYCDKCRWERMQPKRKPKETICAKCGKSFRPKTGSRRKICDSCHAEWKEAAAENRLARQGSKEKTCKGCGEIFDPKGLTRKYCDACVADGTAEKIAAEKRRVWQRNRYYTENPIASRREKRIRRKKETHIPLEEFNALARQAGMSYGKYESMLHNKKMKGCAV